MSDIIVNKVALACDLAEAQTKAWFDTEAEIYVPNPDGEGTIYSDEAQDIFGMYYDRYMTIIERNEFPGQIRT